MTTPLTSDTFRPFLNKKFMIIFDSENSYEVELIEVKASKPIPNMPREPFSLMFKGDRSETIFAQHMYTVQAEDFVPVELFLIPRAPDDEGIYYEAIFN